MRLSRLSICLGLVAVLSGCQVIDKFMGITSGSTSTSLPADIPTAPPPTQTPKAPAPKPTQQRVASSLVIYVGSTAEVSGYTQVTQKGRTVYVDPRQTLVYTDLSNALAVLDESNNPYVNLVFSQAGSQKLSNLTAQNVGKSLIVTLNNELISILKIDGRNSNGILHVPMKSVSDAQTVERRILDGE